MIYNYLLRKIFTGPCQVTNVNQKSMWVAQCNKQTNKQTQISNKQWSKILKAKQTVFITITKTSKQRQQHKPPAMHHLFYLLWKLGALISQNLWCLWQGRCPTQLNVLLKTRMTSRRQLSLMIWYSTWSSVRIRTIFGFCRESADTQKMRKRENWSR